MVLSRSLRCRSLSSWLTRLCLLLWLCHCCCWHQQRHIVVSASSTNDPSSTGNCEARSVSAGQCATLDKAKAIVTGYLSSTKDKGTYKVLGWRWHTLAVSREAELLRRLAVAIERDAESSAEHGQDKHELLTEAAEYVVNFNMKGLHEIESNQFYPWILRQVAKIETESVADAFQQIVNDIIQDQKDAQRIGADLMTSTKSTDKDSQKIVATHAAALSQKCAQLVQKQGDYLVPFISSYIPTMDQDVFNLRVLTSLGMLNSRLYLVSMHEAVVAMNDPKEMELFRQHIPSVARTFIGRWKRLLYEPKVGALLAHQQDEEEHSS